MRISKGLTPPGGWSYQEGEYWIHGAEADDLIANLAAHRKNNGHEVGDPWADITAQKCYRNPEICLDQKDPMTAALERALAFLQSLKNYLLTGGHLVDQNTANIRASICACCHANVPGEQARPSAGFCSSCSKVAEDVTITASKALILQGRTTTHEGQLKSCSICGCDNKLQVWFPTVPLGMHQTNVNAYPSQCWKKELND